MNKNQVTDIVNFVIETKLEQFKQDFDLAPIPVSPAYRTGRDTSRP